jgi:hypothetical protein
LADVEVVLGAVAPGEVEEGFEVGARDAVLAAGRLHEAEAVELLLDDLLVDLLGEVLLFDARLRSLEVALAVEVAELVLDGLELLAEVVLALVLVDLFLDLGLDLVGDA